MQEKLKLYAVKVVQYHGYRVFYGTTETGDVPAELYGRADESGDECLIEIIPVLDIPEIDEYTKTNNLVEVEVHGIEDFYDPSPPNVGTRWFVRLFPVEVTVTSKRKSLLRSELEPVRKTLIRKNIRLNAELSKRLELFADQNGLHASDVIEAALQQYLNK